jgi:2-C-methyl-D-erythritol 4-phosphate cytidylyltransferase / 2-C-methyl-D-erythritol 2,4-cyclodiphosphate synthase
MNHAIILAAGQGQRMKMRKDKMLAPVAGFPMLYYSLMTFNDHPEIDTVTIVASKINKDQIQRLVDAYQFPKVAKLVMGGRLRQHSLESGLKTLEKIAKKDDIILVHNGDNPLPSEKEIAEVITTAQEHGAAICGHKVTDTIKEVKDDKVSKTHDRKNLFAAQTPQAAKYQILKKAVANAKAKKLECTDEAMMLEAIKQKVKTVEADEHNFKVTTQGDLLKLKIVLGETPEDFRIGIGQDSHMFDDTEKGLALGGLLLPNEQKLKANSDGDVVLHAIFNAISQANGDNSLGFYADPLCEEGIKDSKKYIELILKKIKKDKFKINSVGIMIECGDPKIDPIAPKIKKSLAKILGVDTRRIGVTATSGEDLTAFGSGLGIQCFAIVSIRKS